MGSTPLSISAVIICRNEVRSIRACISALLGCVDEIVVIDSGSSDGTLDVLRSMGIEPIFHSFEGYGKQKQYAISQAKNLWVLSVDADEILSEDLRNELVHLNVDPEVSAYRVFRRFRFLGRTFLHGHGATDRPTRVFRTDRCRYDSASVHESVIVEGRIGLLGGEMLHESYIDLAQYFEKFNRYTTLAAEDLVRSGRKRSVVISGMTIPFYFLKHYVLWGHYRNGIHGFIWSILSSFYPFVKVAKAWALRKQ